MLSGLADIISRALRKKQERDQQPERKKNKRNPQSVVADASLSVGTDKKIDSLIESMKTLMGEVNSVKATIGALGSKFTYIPTYSTVGKPADVVAAQLSEQCRIPTEKARDMIMIKASLNSEFKEILGENGEIDYNKLKQKTEKPQKEAKSSLEKTKTKSSRIKSKGSGGDKNTYSVVSSMWCGIR